MGKIIKDGVAYSGSSSSAKHIKYDHSKTELTSGNVQTAIDELSDKVSELQKNNSAGESVDDLEQEIIEIKNDLANKAEQEDIDASVESYLDGAKADIAQQVLNALGGIPIFGTVDDNKVITITSGLTDGEYTLGYKNEDGSFTEIVKFTFDNTDEVVIINLFDSTATGFGNNTRLSSSDGSMKTEGSVSGAVVTNFIHFQAGTKSGDKIYFKGIRFDTALSDGNTPIAWRYSAKDQTTKIGAIYINALFTQEPDKISYDSTTGITTYIPNNTIGEGEYIRFGGVLDNCTVEDIVITFNQEIE